MPQIIIDHNFSGYRTIEGYCEVVLSYDTKEKDEAFLGLVNHILLQQRQKAWDHEPRDAKRLEESPGISFYGAALVKTSDGKYFTAANIHMPNSPTTRNCAETNAITDAAQVNGAQTLEITDVWFLGGLGDYEKGTFTLPNQIGRKNCPCGSCLDVIYNNRCLTRPTHIHIIALNDGQSALLPSQVETRTINELFPELVKYIEDPHDFLKQAMRDGWDFVSKTSPGFSEEEIDAMVSELHAVPEEKRLAQINRIMMETIRLEYNRSKHILTHACVALVRGREGKFKMGTRFMDGSRLGLGSAVLDAIQDAHGCDVTETYRLLLPCAQMPAILKRYDENPAARFELTMPDGETRDRTHKARLKDPNTDVAIHIFVPNNVRNFDPNQHVIKTTSKQLLPYGFVPGKEQIRDLFHRCDHS